MKNTHGGFLKWGYPEKMHGLFHGKSQTKMGWWLVGVALWLRMLPLDHCRMDQWPHGSHSSHVHGLHVPQFRWILTGSELSLVGMICMVKCDQNPGSTGLTRQGLNRLCLVLTPGIQRCDTSGHQTWFAGKSEQRAPFRTSIFSRSRAKLLINLPYGGVSIYGGTPIAGWFTMGNPI